MDPKDIERQVIRDVVADLSPYDALEAEHRRAALEWIDAGSALYRADGVAGALKHLVVYFAPFDQDARALLLVDHRKAGAWLLPGGHVEPGEDPIHTVRREAAEELALDAEFDASIGSAPLFLTINRTRGPASHIDVTLWFVLQTSQAQAVEPDLDEFEAIRWFGLDGPDWSSESFDPHMDRFVAKLRSHSEPTPPA